MSAFFFFRSSRTSFPALSAFSICLAFSGSTSGGISVLAALSRIACIFASASSTLAACDLDAVEVTTSSPSLLMRFFSALFTASTSSGSSQSVESRFRRRSALVLTLLTFCPPAPPERANWSATSAVEWFFCSDFSFTVRSDTRFVEL